MEGCIKQLPVIERIHNHTRIQNIDTHVFLKKVASVYVFVFCRFFFFSRSRDTCQKSCLNAPLIASSEKRKRIFVFYTYYMFFLSKLCARVRNYLCKHRGSWEESYWSELIGSHIMHQILTHLFHEGMN